MQLTHNKPKTVLKHSAWSHGLFCPFEMGVLFHKVSAWLL